MVSSDEASPTEVSAVSHGANTALSAFELQQAKIQEERNRKLKGLQDQFEADRKAEEEARIKAEKEKAQREKFMAVDALLKSIVMHKELELARAKAAEEEKRKAEEARIKAEQEAKRKAEEAKRKAEEEKRKAEEARIKAEQEAKRKAELEAKRKQLEEELQSTTSQLAQTEKQLDEAKETLLNRKLKRSGLDDDLAELKYQIEEIDKEIDEYSKRFSVVMVKRVDYGFFSTKGIYFDKVLVDQTNASKETIRAWNSELRKTGRVVIKEHLPEDEAKSCMEAINKANGEAIIESCYGDEDAATYADITRRHNGALKDLHDTEAAIPKADAALKEVKGNHKSLQTAFNKIKKTYDNIKIELDTLK
jgi:hypothetical protein